MVSMSNFTSYELDSISAWRPKSCVSVLAHTSVGILSLSINEYQVPASILHVLVESLKE